MYVYGIERRVLLMTDCLHSTQLFSLLLNCPNNTDIEIGLHYRAFCARSVTDWKENGIVNHLCSGR